MMRHRPHLVGAAMSLFAFVAIASTPAVATPCTNLLSLNLPDTTITSATDNTTGSFTPPGSSTPITGLPAFCRVTATLIPTSDSNIKVEIWLPETTWNGRFLGTGGGGFQWDPGRLCCDQQRSRHRFIRMQPALLRFGRQYG